MRKAPNISAKVIKTLKEVASFFNVLLFCDKRKVERLYYQNFIIVSVVSPEQASSKTQGIVLHKLWCFTKRTIKKRNLFCLQSARNN